MVSVSATRRFSELLSANEVNLLPRFLIEPAAADMDAVAPILLGKRMVCDTY